MLHPGPSDFTLVSFLASVDRLRLDRVRIRGFGPTILSMHWQESGHLELIALLNRYRRGLCAGLAEGPRRRLQRVTDEARQRLQGVAGLVRDAPLTPSHRQAVVSVARMLVSLSTTALALGRPMPPLAWAAWRSLAAGHCVTALAPTAAVDPQRRRWPQEAFAVDVGLLDPRGVEELVGATVERADVEPVSSGAQLRLLTQRRGM